MRFLIFCMCRNAFSNLLFSSTLFYHLIIYRILYIYVMLCVLGMNDDVSMYGIYIYAYISGWPDCPNMGIQ